MEAPEELDLPRVRVDTNTLDRHKQHFREFLDSQEFGDYRQHLTTVLGNKGRRLLIDLNDLREFDMELTRRVLRNPLEYLLALESAVKELAKEIDPSFGKLKQGEIKVGFDGSFGQNHVSPRELTSRRLSQLVCVEGIVTKCSPVRPKVVQSVHYCPAKDTHLLREYRDATCTGIGIEAGGRPMLPTQTVYPQKDPEGNPLETEYGLSTYKDHQSVVIQEMPERAPLGQMPRSVNLIVEYDLVDKVKPGDRVQCMGIFKAMAPGGSAAASSTSGVFSTVLLVNNVKQIGKDNGTVKMSGDTIRHIRELSQEQGVLDTLSRSIAPSIFGHEYIKKALILQAVGGCEKITENNTHLRGDINVLMVGDPSTAKSQLLRAVMNTAILAISTTGRGSSGVGLTAAVVSDSETGERRLEAGAMVLADRGTVCIDEFDKMSEGDRVAIHEVMEQQTVTIAKAGIHASLNARCSVLAAANPVYGQYNKHKSVQENIGLPDSLLSRFDLLFIVLDQIDPTLDRAIAEHVLRAHSYRRPGAEMEPDRPTSGPIDISRQEEEEAAERVWQRYNPLARNDTNQRRGPDGRGPDDILHKDFLRKYVFFAKSRPAPKFTAEADDAISSFFSTLRSKQERRTVPITVRTLETLIRLSEAHAKIRLSTEVTMEDCEVAMDLLSFALYHEGDNTDSARAALAKARGPATRASLTGQGTGEGEEQENTEDMDEENNENDPSNVNRRRKGDADELEDDEDDETRSLKRAKSQEEAEDNTREKVMLRVLEDMFRENGEAGVAVTDLMDRLSGVDASFDNEEVMGIIQQLDDMGKLLFEDQAQILYPA